MVLLCLRMSLRRLVWRSDSLVVVVVLSGLELWIMGHVRRPSMWGSTSVNVMSGRMSPSTTLPGTRIRRIVVDDARVRFDLTEMGREA